MARHMAHGAYGHVPPYGRSWRPRAPLEAPFRRFARGLLVGLILDSARGQKREAGIPSLGRNAEKTLLAGAEPEAGRTK